MLAAATMVVKTVRLLAKYSLSTRPRSHSLLMSPIASGYSGP
jgi:hypothetical protein